MDVAAAFFTILIVLLSLYFFIQLQTETMKRIPGLPPYPLSVPVMVTNKGQWSSIGERYMVSCFENIFKAKFTKIRPSWLTNPKTKRNLELDCYNETLRIAGEYNGRQHYSYTPYFHKDEKDFQEQKNRDACKYNACQRNNVLLVTVPYTVSQSKMQQFIYKELVRKMSSS